MGGTFAWFNCMHDSHYLHAHLLLLGKGYRWALGSPEMALAALGIYILGFSLGLGPVPWLILVELFPTEVVNKAASVAVGVAWISTFLVDLLFLPLEEAITKEGIFLSFTIFCATCFFFVLTLVPETKGRTVAQVLALMQDRNDITSARAVPNIKDVV